MSSLIYWIVCLISSHLLADFPLQSDKIIKLKKDSRGKFLHAAIHGILAYSICGQWQLWLLPVIIGISHGLIDLIGKKGWQQYLLDQLLHFIVLGACLFILPFPKEIVWNLPVIWFFKGLSIISGIIIITSGSGILIGLLMAQHVEKNELKLSGLTGGGMLVGYLERLLILMFVLFNIPAGIGFLITAKSILRFNEVKEKQKMAEYVLIGTLLSFSVAIPISFLVSYLLTL